jgi:hypothetical protein
LADPKGLWLAQDGAHVKVGPCGAGLCATIASPSSAVDPETGRPWTDKYNPDPALRGRPLVGVPVLYGLVPDGPIKPYCGGETNVGAAGQDCYIADTAL